MSWEEQVWEAQRVLIERERKEEDSKKRKSMAMSKDKVEVNMEGKGKRQKLTSEVALEQIDEAALTVQLVKWVKEHGVVSTANTYATYIKQFRSFCEVGGLTAFPASPTSVAAFLKHLHEKGLAKSTTNVASAAIASEYKLADEKTPTQSKLVQAVKAVIGREGKPEQPKEPLTVELLQRIVRDTKKNSWTDTRDNFMIVLLMAAMLRESELVALRMQGENEDVWLENYKEGEGTEYEVLFVYVEKSKTDQERHGHTIVVGPAEDKSICPVALFKQWKKVRWQDNPFLFHAKSADRKLSNQTPNGRLKARLARIGVDPKKFGSHSGRRGMATAAAASRVHERLMRKHGNWRSDCIYRYIDESMANRLQVSAAVFRPQEFARNSAHGSGSGSGSGLAPVG